MGKAANRSSGHAGVEWSNELLMGNGHSCKFKSLTDPSFWIFVSRSSQLTTYYDIDQVAVPDGQTSVQDKRNKDALLFAL